MVQQNKMIELPLTEDDILNMDSRIPVTQTKNNTRTITINQSTNKQQHFEKHQKMNDKK
jgi:hypothetical protein